MTKADKNKGIQEICTRTNGDSEKVETKEGVKKLISEEASQIGNVCSIKLCTVYCIYVGNKGQSM